jgi:peptide-methionine (R)-S-oxide reductase
MHMNRRGILLLLASAALVAVGGGIAWSQRNRLDEQLADSKRKGPAMSNQPASGEGKIAKSDEEWRRQLTPEQYNVCRECGTERAFTGKYWNEHRQGDYLCVACGQELFESEHKFDSGTGWPSFYQPAAASAVETQTDESWFAVRTEIRCSRCGAHLGHVFDDGPAPTGLRYCINSAALKFVEKPK